MFDKKLLFGPVETIQIKITVEFYLEKKLSQHGWCFSAIQRRVLGDGFTLFWHAQ